MKILNEDDLRPGLLSRHMLRMLQTKSSLKSPSIDLNGAANAARILCDWVNKTSGITQ
jgi:predicted glycosyltransferase